MSDQLTTRPPETTDAAARTPVRAAGVLAIGMATPSGVVDNAAIASRHGLPDGWIESRTGISQRRHADAAGTLTELAALAAARALERAELAPADLDLVVFATTTADDLLPNAAPVLAHALGSRAAAIDVGAACTGFVSALTLAAGQVETGRAETALVVGADLMSRVVDPDDRDTSVLFGDGAGAAIVSARADGGRIGPAVLGSDGASADLIRLPRGGCVQMAGQDTFRCAVDTLSESTAAVVERAGIQLGDVDLFVFHQANGRILRAVGERLGLEPERVVDCIRDYGNTSAATIPIALCEARAAGLLFDGARVVLGAFGAGLTWGAATLEWGSA